MQVFPGKASVASDLFFVLLSALLFSVPAFLNGFPFLFPDSIDYIWIHSMPVFRSPFYAGMIFFFHLNASIWPVILFQGAVTAYVVLLFLRSVIRVTGYVKPFLVVMGLTVLSSVPFFTGFIMADIFTSLLILLILITGFGWEALATREKIFVSAFLTISLVVHITHIVLGIASEVLLIAVTLLLKRSVVLHRQALVLLIGAPVLALGLTFASNILVHKVVAISPAGESFLLANLIQSGPAVDYLKENCSKKNYKLCPYVNRMPLNADNFLWDEGGIFKSVGGFDGMRAESADIVSGTFRSYPVRVLASMAANFYAAVLAQKNGAEFVSYLKSMPPLTDLIGKKFGPSARDAYMNSLQSRDLFPIRFTEMAGYIGLGLSIVVIGLGFIRLRDRQLQIVVGLTLLGVLMNDFMCAAFSGVHDRYQARVSWLIVLCACAVLCRFRSVSIASRLNSGE